MNGTVQTISNVSGGSAFSSGALVPFLHENAKIIGLAFTALTFSVYLTCSILNQVYKWKQAQLDTALKEKQLKGG